MAPFRVSGLVWTILSLVAFLSFADATQYTVGGSTGWNTGVDYTTWAAKNTYKVGDSLEFPYSAGTHSVLQVSEADFKACNTANALSSETSGNTVVKLDTAQTYYFICGVAGHCQLGMQLSVTVTSGTAPSSPTTSPSIPSTTPSTPTTPSTGSSSSSSSASAAAPIARMAPGGAALSFGAAISILCICMSI